jgi:hypothetical protein
MRVLLLLILIVPATALAYIGPGAGVSFLGSLWAVLAGIVIALVAILAWPIRYFVRRLRKGRAAARTAPPRAD